MVKTTYNISSVELLTDIHRHRINNITSKPYFGGLVVSYNYCKEIFLFCSEEAFALHCFTITVRGE